MACAIYLGRVVGVMQSVAVPRGGDVVLKAQSGFSFCRGQTYILQIHHFVTQSPLLQVQRFATRGAAAQ